MTSGVRLSNLNHSYFETWNPNMAYILGFTCADGCVYGRTLSWELSNKFPSDKQLLERFAKELSSTYLIEERPRSFRLRINSAYMVKSLFKFGIVRNKTKILAFPDIPKEFLRHFIRGFLDGDGWISMRNKRKSNEVNLGFVNGSKLFTEGLIEAIEKNVFINTHLAVKTKVTQGGVLSTYYKIEFYCENANKLIKYLYDDLSDNDLFLIRKYEKQINARKLYAESQKIINFGKGWARKEKENNIDINLELNRMFVHDKIIPKEIASKIGVSLATIYRWLEKINLRIPAVRGSLEWKKRIFGERYGQDTIVKGTSGEMQTSATTS